MPVIAVLHRDEAARAAIRRAVMRRRSGVRSCRSVERVGRILARQVVDAVVVDVRGSGVDGIAELARRYPGIPCIGYSRFRADDGTLLRACWEAGVREFVVQGVDEPVVGDLIASRSLTGAWRRALADAPRLLRLTEPLQLQVWEAVLAGAEAPLRTDVLADALERSREHLSREFGAGGAPNLKRVIDLVRVSLAAHMLANPGYGVPAVAAILGFSSAGHLSGTATRVAGVPAGALGDLGSRGVLLRFRRGRMRSRF